MKDKTDQTIYLQNNSFWLNYSVLRFFQKNRKKNQEDINLLLMSDFMIPVGNDVNPRPIQNVKFVGKKLEKKAETETQDEST